MNEQSFASATSLPGAKKLALSEKSRQMQAAPDRRDADIKIVRKIARGNLHNQGSSSSITRMADYTSAPQRRLARDTSVTDGRTAAAANGLREDSGTSSDQPRRPNPLVTTAAPRRPTTTAAPG